jgi:S-formylglutathione hydrolase FrmB
LKNKIVWSLVAVLCLCAVLRCHRPVSKVQVPGAQEITFHSKSLDRDMSYWVVLPEGYQAHPSQQYPTLYLLHGHGGAPTESIQNGHLLDYIRPYHWILAMPDGKDSYYMNSAEKSGDRFEDYIVRDVADDVEAKFRAVPKREGRMLAGISMGGFGAEKIGLRHPEIYRLIGALSSPADATRRKFSYRRPINSFVFWKDFGPMNSQTRKDNDPFLLAASADPKALPFFYLGCGTKDNLEKVDHQLARLFTERHIPHTYREFSGGHDWGYWDQALQDMTDEFAHQLATGN